MAIKSDSPQEKRKLRSIDKVAIVLLSLPKNVVSNIMTRLEPSEVRELSLAMMNLGTVGPELIESTYSEFSKKLQSTTTLIGTPEKTENLLKSIFPEEEVKRIMSELSGSKGQILWDKLSKVNEELLANFLKNEYPQTVSVVLSRINPENAARILSILPEKFAMNVIIRLLRLEPVRRDILDDVEQALQNEFMSNLNASSQCDTFQLVAEVFDHLDKKSEARFMKALTLESKEFAEKVRSLMFTFDDIKKINDTSIQTLIRHINREKLAMALKGASESLKRVFLRNMSERVGKLLLDDIKTLGMVRMRDVDEAQANIVTVAKELISSKAILIEKQRDAGDRFVE